MTSGPRRLLVASLGVVPYADALALQRNAARARIDGRLILLEHPAVVTTGRSTKEQNLLLDRAALAERGIELFDVERGGDVTFHGPGQIVGYPIIDLKGHKEDLHWYLRQVEQLLMDALATLGISADRNPGKTGVWTNGRKIASIGVHAKQWVTSHGFALNVTTDLSFFDVMVPCGITDVEMPSVPREMADRADSAYARPSATLLDDVGSAVTVATGALFGLEPTVIGRAQLEDVTRSALAD